jgi:hypothetical protein
MEGSSPSASIDGSRITVTGPFASGTTPVRVQFAVRHGSTERTIEQTFPVALQRVIVGVEKVTNAVAMASPQFGSVNELPTDSGLYLLGQGGSLAPGTPLSVTLTNLPLHSRAPRYVALGLVATIVALGVWLAATARRSADRDLQALAARRDVLLGELTLLERRRRDGVIGEARYEARRQRLVSQLEQLYAELDEAGAGPKGGGEGIAA